MISEANSRVNTIVIAVFLFIALFSSGAFFWNLSKSAIANADEGVHALVTREIRERPDWITMHIRGGTYFRKPPLSFWIRGVSHIVFGENEFAARLPSALAGVATTLLLCAWAWQWTKRWQTVLATGVIYPLLPSTFVHTFRTGETDGVLLFLLTLTGYLLWRSTKRPWLIVAAGATTGLAFMTKSVAAGSVPIAFGLTLLFLKRWMFTWKQVLIAIAAFFIIAAPWHIAESVYHGKTFWGEYIGYHVIERVEEPLHITPKTHGKFWYLTSVEQGMYPWSWLVIPALAFALAELRRSRRSSPGLRPSSPQRGEEITEAFLLMWSVAVVALFSLAGTKLAWYVAPAFPALTLLIARLVTERWRSVPAWIGWLTVIMIGGYAYETTRQYTTGVGRVASLSFLPVIAVVALFVIAAWYSRFGKKWSNVVATLLLAHVFLFSFIVYSRNVRKTYESPFRVFRDEIVKRDERAQVFIFPIGYITSPLSAIYLAGPHQARTVTALRENTDALSQTVASQPGAFILFDADHPVPAELQEKLQPVQTFESLSIYRVK